LQPLFFLLRIGDTSEDAAGENDVGKVRFNDKTTCKALHQDHDVNWSAVESPVFLGERHGCPAEFGKCRPDIAAVSLVAARVVLPSIEIIFVVDELADTVGQHRLYFVVCKIHDATYRPSTCLAMMFF